MCGHCTNGERWYHSKESNGVTFHRQHKNKLSSLHLTGPGRVSYPGPGKTLQTDSKDAQGKTTASDGATKICETGSASFYFTSETLYVRLLFWLKSI